MTKKINSKNSNYVCNWRGSAYLQINIGHADARYTNTKINYTIFSMIIPPCIRRFIAKSHVLFYGRKVITRIQKRFVMLYSDWK